MHAPVNLPGQFALSEALEQRMSACRQHNDFPCAARLLDSLIRVQYEAGDHDAVFHLFRRKSDVANKMDAMRAYLATYRELDSLFTAGHVSLEEDYIFFVHLWNDTNLGNYYNKIGAFEQSKAVFNRHLEILDSIPLKLYSYYSNDHLHLGNIYKKQGQYDLALGHLERSLVFADSFEAEATYKGLVHKHFGDVYKEMEDYPKAKGHYETSLALFSNVAAQADTNRLINTCNAYADLHRKLGEVNAALRLLRTSLSYQLPKDPFRTETYRELGITYTQMEDWDNAAYYFHLALEHDRYQVRNQQTAQTYLAIGDMNRKRGRMGEALEYYEAAVQQLAGRSPGSGYCRLPNGLDIAYDQKTLLLALYRLAEVYYSFEDKSSLYCAWEAADRGLRLAAHIKSGYIGDYDKQYLMEECYGLFETAIEVSYALHRQIPSDTFYINYAFSVSERSKDLLLLEAFRDAQVSDFDLPGDLLQRERLLKFDIQYLSEQLHESEQSGAVRDTLKQRLYRAQAGWKALMKKLEEEAPRYYAAKFDTTTATVGSALEHLRPGHALLEFFVGEDSTWMFYLRPGAAPEVFTLPIARAYLAKAVQEMVHAIYLPFYDGEDAYLKQLKAEYPSGTAKAIYAHRAHQLYEWLIAPLNTLGSGMPQQLIIIPDDILNVLPFDALLTRAVPESEYGYYRNPSYNYLVEDLALSYCSSESLLEEMVAAHRHDHRPRELLALNGAGFEEEIEVIQDEFSFFNLFHWFVHPLWERSNKQELEAVGGDYRFHHYTAHGQLSNRYPSRSRFMLQPWQAGRDSALYLHELYRLPMRQDMVVTSVCNAGIGEIRRGQGMLSMARGFSYGGARSLITTLWEVSSGHTTQIMQGFYRNLRNGMPKHLALTLAKRDYVRRVGDVEAHPYYWSSCVAIGSMSPVLSKGAGWRKPIAAGVLLAVILIWGFRRLQRDRSARA